MGTEKRNSSWLVQRKPAPIDIVVLEQSNGLRTNLADQRAVIAADIPVCGIVSVFAGRTGRVQTNKVVRQHNA